MKFASHLTWVWKKSTLKTMFFAYIPSKMDYAAPAWQTWLSNTNFTRMERLYDRALRIATGQLVSTPIEALQRKAMSQATQQLAVKTSSKQKRNPYTAQQTIQNKLPSMSKYHSGCSWDQDGDEKQKSYRKHYQMPLITANRWNH